MPLRLLTSGESHGPALQVILDGLPAGLRVTAAAIDGDLARRQQGHGRGGRMLIERDRAEITGGVRHGRTIGGPVGLRIANLDWRNWLVAMAVGPVNAPDAALRRVTRPRPGHADLAGALKFGTYDARDVLERASARETAARVAAGALCRLALAELGIEVLAHTLGLGTVALDLDSPVPWSRIAALPASSPLRCTDARAEARMIRLIDRCRREGDSVGGVFEVVARGVPAGLGSFSQSDRRLDGRLAAALATIPAVKAVAIGGGFGAGCARGSSFHDEIGWSPARKRFTHRTNRAGGIEGGLTNGEEIRVRANLKPLSTLTRPLRSVDLVTRRPAHAQVERTDATPILAAGIVGEAAVAFVLLGAALEKFGGDTMAALRRGHAAFERDLDHY